MLNSIVISCFSENDPQFSGINRTIKLLDKTREFKRIEWNCLKSYSIYPPYLYKKIDSIIVTGHGSSEYARIGDNRGNFFTPHSLKRFLAIFSQTPEEKTEGSGLRLYLICCHQGSKHNIEEWSRRSKIEKRNIFATPDETETALSTLFFLHLLEDVKTQVYNKSSTGKWFNLWKNTNIYLAPHFEEMREIYLENAGNPEAVIEKLKRILFCEEIKEFTNLYYRYPQFLEGLGRKHH